MNLLVKKGKLNNKAILFYEQINDEILNTFGISDKYFEIIRLKIKIESMWIKVLEKNERYLIAQIQPLERELEAKLTQEPKKNESIRMSLMAIEKNMGIKLDYKTLSIRDFYEYCKYLEETSKLYQNELSKKNI